MSSTDEARKQVEEARQRLVGTVGEIGTAIDDTKAEAVLAKLRFGETPSSAPVTVHPGDVTVRVVNGSGMDGPAGARRGRRRAKAGGPGRSANDRGPAKNAGRAARRGAAFPETAGGGGGGNRGPAGGVRPGRG